MLVWGGQDGSGGVSPGGASYDPATDTWSPIGSSSGPYAYAESPEWTGTQALYYFSNSSLSTPYARRGRYDPIGDSWIPMSRTGGPPARPWAHTAWAGTEMIIWGGDEDRVVPTPPDGGIYNPVTDTWRAMSTLGEPPMRCGSCHVWTGTQLIVWGGSNLSGSTCTNVGGIYDYPTDTWTAMDTVGSPIARIGASAIWTGTEMVMWGGLAAGGSPLRDGGRWSPTPVSAHPSAPPTVRGRAVATLRLSPNPCADLLRVEGMSRVDAVRVVALDGRVVDARVRRIGADALDLSALPSGVYAISVGERRGTVTMIR